jgi:hypothetical protein
MSWEDDRDGYDRDATKRQIKLCRIDGWRKIAAVLTQQTVAA